MPLRARSLARVPPPSPLAWAAYVWIALCLGCSVRAFLKPTSHTVYRDYAHAGRCWLQGADAYEFERDASGAYTPNSSGYRYTPLVSILLVPFSLLPNALGGAVWRLVSYACFLGAFAWFVREVLPGAHALAAKGKAALWLLIVPLSLDSMNNGQANVLLMALLLAAGAAVATERWNLAAVFLAGAVILKLYPLAIALLMLVVYPRQLGWRFLLALGIGLAVPFALQHPGYVLGQYENLFQILTTDDRRDFALNKGYRDFYLLTRFFGPPIHPQLYLVLQLGAAALVAAVCFLGRLYQWPKKHLLQTLFALGCSWMVVFGPSTESCTFILIAPALAWAMVEAFQHRSGWTRMTPVLVMAMFLTTWFPGGGDWFYVLQPLSAAVFFVERILCSRPQPEPHVAVDWTTFSQAA